MNWRTVRSAFTIGRFTTEEIDYAVKLLHQKIGGGCASCRRSGKWSRKASI